MVTDSARQGTVRDWMTREPAAVSDDCPIRTALAGMRAAVIRHLLVLEDDRLVGILSTRDVGRLLADGPPDARLAEPVRTIMTEAPVAVGPATPVTVAARALLDAKIGALPVRDGERIVGIFTTADALEALLAIVEAPLADAALRRVGRRRPAGAAVSHSGAAPWPRSPA